MSHSLLVITSLSTLVYGQDTGGPYTGNSGTCIDNKGQIIEEGRLYEPGPDECQVCTCLRQLPVLCRTVLCAPPQGCRSLRVGDACCEWVCDQWEEDITGSVSDIGLRLMASAITAIFSLSLLFFLIYRLRQRKLRGRQNHFEAEGYSQDDTPADDVAVQAFHLHSLKPQDRIMLRRPFPPSYNEAMMFGAAASQEVSDQDAPPYNSITQDPVVPHTIATLGRLVLPSIEASSSSTMRRVLRRSDTRQSSSSPSPPDQSNQTESSPSSITSSSHSRPVSSSSSNRLSSSTDSEAIQTYV